MNSQTIFKNYFVMQIRCFIVMVISRFPFTLLVIEHKQDKYCKYCPFYLCCFGSCSNLNHFLFLSLCEIKPFLMKIPLGLT